jgi:hypothetical protein
MIMNGARRDADDLMTFDELFDEYKMEEKLTVLKVGARTGLTYGFMEPIERHITKTTTYSRVLLIYSPPNAMPFSLPGDSGSVIYHVDEETRRLSPVGLLRAGHKVASTAASMTWDVQVSLNDGDAKCIALSTEIQSWEGFIPALCAALALPNHAIGIKLRDLDVPANQVGWHAVRDIFARAVSDEVLLVTSDSEPQPDDSDEEGGAEATPTQNADMTIASVLRNVTDHFRAKFKPEGAVAVQFRSAELSGIFAGVVGTPPDALRQGGPAPYRNFESHCAGICDTDYRD